jgi:hypothetical protein
VESWESFDLESLSYLLLLGGINLSEVVWRVVLGKSLGGLGILGGKLLTVTATNSNTCKHHMVEYKN